MYFMLIVIIKLLFQCFCLFFAALVFYGTEDVMTLCVVHVSAVRTPYPLSASFDERRLSLNIWFPPGSNVATY